MDKLLPMQDGEEFAVLESNIWRNGCYAPIIVHDVAEEANETKAQKVEKILPICWKN